MPVEQTKDGLQAGSTAMPILSDDGRILSLDGLRAVSIWLVLIGHLAGTVGAPEILRHFHSLGNYGVRFFFIISGLLITWLLLRELEKTGTINLWRFFWNRVLRIFPAFYTYILIGAALATCGLIDLRPGDLFHAATYTMNYHEDRAWHFNHTWSLAVEEQFYLIWPLALLFVKRKHAPYCLAALLLVIPAVRAVMWYNFEASPSAMMREFQAVVDTLAVGCLMAFAYKNGQITCATGTGFRPLLWCAAFGLFGVSAAMYLMDKGLFYVVGQSITNIAVALVIHLTLSSSRGFVFQILNSRIALFFGAISYSLYLWQEPFLNSYETGWAQSFPANIGLTIIVAWLSYKMIEKPCLRLKSFSLVRMGLALRAGNRAA